MDIQQLTGDVELQAALDKLKARNIQFSDIIDDKGCQYVDLVMEGGGMLGIALVGYTSTF